jgi:hypothetical protein
VREVRTAIAACSSRPSSGPPRFLARPSAGQVPGVCWRNGICRPCRGGGLNRGAPGVINNVAIDLMSVLALTGGFVVVPTLLFAVARIEVWMDESRENREPPER